MVKRCIVPMLRAQIIHHPSPHVGFFVLVPFRSRWGQRLEPGAGADEGAAADLLDANDAFGAALLAGIGLPGPFAHGRRLSDRCLWGEES